MSTQAAQGPTRPQSRTRPARKDRKGSAVDRSLNWIDDRLGVSKAGRTFMDKIFPDHWSFMLGEIALYSFVVLVATGIFLTLYYIPSSKEVIYHGSYLPLKGRKMSEI